MTDRAYPLLSNEEYECLDSACPGYATDCNAERRILIRTIARLHDELMQLGSELVAKEDNG